MASSDSVEANNDLISNMPKLVIANIFKHLPLRVVVKMSTFSRTWRRNWLSCNNVFFDSDFWKDFRKDDGYDWQKGSSVISNILFHHNGRIHSFLLVLKPDRLLVEKNISLSQWLSLLSRTCPKKISLINHAIDCVSMPSYIFHCTELTKVKLMSFVLYALPLDFKGFPYLETLKLIFIEFRHGFDVLWSLVAKCPCLICLSIEYCRDMDLIDVDVPTLESLTIKGEFDSISLKNCPRLFDVSLYSTKLHKSGSGRGTLVATIKSLATSYDELQYLKIKGDMCKFLGAGGINKPLPSAFNNLCRLCLAELRLTDPDVFCFTVTMIQSCPFIEELVISLSSIITVCEQKYECNSDNYKLGKLRSVKITSITGSTAELKLIEYLLALSVVLEKLILKFAGRLFLRFAPLSDATKYKVTRDLIRFPRASKAEVICLDK